MIEAFRLNIGDTPTRITGSHQEFGTAQTTLVEILGESPVYFGGPDVTHISGFRVARGGSINGGLINPTDQLYAVCEPGQASQIQAIKTGL